MGQGDVPTPRGGPLRRRRDKRQLERLADASERDVTPRASSAHVRVIEDEPDAMDRDREGQDSEGQEPEAQDPEGPAEVWLPRHGGFHVRAVPIDEPVGE
jgi:hypothetical protein